jgi:hypothetical protein
MYSRRWLIVALVACGLASACSNYNTNLSIQTSSSILTFVSPSSATAGAQGFTITANGSGFVTGALILWNGTALTTTLVSSNQLTAPVPTSDLTAAGTVQVAVQIPGSAQSGTSNVNNTTTTEVSNIVLFTISATPGTPPAITSLSASTTSAASTPYCSTQGFTLTVTGTNFTSDAIVDWNGAAQATTFVSATQLTASIPATAAVSPGTIAVTVSNSIGTSGSKPFTLSTPAGGFATPTLTSITPNSAAAGAGGSPAFTVTAQGTSILPCTVVQWVNNNNVTTNLSTTYVPAVAATQTSQGNPIELVATIPAADLVSPGTANLDLVNPGTAASSRLGFTINAPTITSLSSSTNSSNTTPACGPPGVTLTVNGANFVNGSVVDWITQATPPVTSALATTFVSSTQLIATIPAQDLAAAGMVNIQVSNSGVVSNTLPFTISASSPPAPAITSISQTGATAGAAAFSLTVKGTNLLPCSIVQWTNGSTTTQLATTYVAPTTLNPAQLVATVPAADIAAVGTAMVAVASPAASANTSNAISFTIALATITSISASTSSSNSTTYCSQTGLTLTVNGTGFEAGLVVNWNGSPRPTTLVSATQMTAEISTADTAFLATGAAAVAITVSGGSPATNSNSLKFSLTALPSGSTFPTPVINSISPPNAAVETLTGPPVALTVNGSSLSPCSIVQWNGAPLPTNIFIGTSGIAAVIPAVNITASGTVQVSVTTPAPGGGTSGNQVFTVYSPGSARSTSLAGGALSLPLMSSNQRYGVFVQASTTGSSETPGTTQNIFVDDTCQGAPSGCSPSVTLVSAGTGGVPGNADSIAPSINAADSAHSSVDGRYVSFLSAATNLVPGVTNGVTNAYVRDTCAGVSSGCTPTTQLVSVTTAGVQANGATTSATVDATGRYVTFESSATNLGAISSSGGIFLRDTCAGVSGCTPSTQPLD